MYIKQFSAFTASNMPLIRRSHRIQEKKVNTPTSSKNNNEITNNSESKVKENKKCVGCLQSFAPIRRYSYTVWIACDQCDKWWHSECACVSEDNISELGRHNIDYTCIFCVIKGSPWIRIPSEDSYTETTTATLDVQSDTTIQEQSTSTCDFNSDKNILVVDNTENPQQLKSSKRIKEVLNKHPQLTEVNYYYSLPRGGIALHLGSSEEARKLENNWPGPVFGAEEKVHRPKGQTPGTVGFLKNISINTSKAELEQFLTYKACRVVALRRLLHRHSGKPMPVWKVDFEANKDLERALHITYPFKLNGKKAFCEASRKYKVVRCFSCQRYGHIANNCTYPSKCENCGSTSHTVDKCQSPKSCANCSAGHSSSSRQCPEYQKLLQSYRKNIIL